MRDAVRAHPVASKLLSSGRAEQSLVWNDPLTGLGCKGRLDWISDAENRLCDLKTTANLDPPFFASRVARYLYHVQLAWYLDGLRESEGLEMSACIIAVESTPPHDVAVFLLDEDAIWAGHEMALGFLRTITQCMKTNEWPGRLETEERELELPAWAFPPEDEDESVPYKVLAAG
jgi:exodeoxyribonuclease VIII